MDLAVGGVVPRRHPRRSRSARRKVRIQGVLKIGVNGGKFDINLDEPERPDHRLQRRARRRARPDRRHALARHRDGPDPRLGGRAVRRSRRSTSRSPASTRPRRSTCSARMVDIKVRPARIDVDIPGAHDRARHRAPRAGRHRLAGFVYVTNHGAGDGHEPRLPARGRRRRREPAARQLLGGEGHGRRRSISRPAATARSASSTTRSSSTRRSRRSSTRAATSSC